MRRKRFRSLAAGAVVLALVAAACGDDGGDSGGDGGGGADCESTDQVSLQLQWFIQAQFAGYFAALAQEGLDPASDVTLVAQQFDMAALLAGDIDAAEAMTYNEYAQVLEAMNPDTGELYQPEDFNVISYEDVGVGMLQDAIWADAERLESDDAYRDIAVRFVTASLQGWAYCRDNVEACRDIVVANGSKLGNSHQLWQMNEINKLIWPAESGVGYIDQAAWDRTVEIAQSTPNLEGATVLTAPPTDGAFTNEIVEAAHALLGDSVDLTGEGFEEIEVTLEPGGS
jgi:NitT/TauT family transport system substrate-binding protein